MPKKPKYRPNRHQEPLFDWDFTVMEILREKPQEESSSPLESPINGGLDEDSSSDITDDGLDMKEMEPRPFQVNNINQSMNDDLLDVAEPSLDNLSQDVLDFINCLRESNASLRQEVRTLKEENIFQMQFSDRLQHSNNECIEMIVDLRERISFLEAKSHEVNDQGSAVESEDTSFKHLMELREKKEECTQLREDLDKFDNALKESKVKVSLLECDVDFYKHEVESLEKTINELKVAKNGGSTQQKTSCLGQSDHLKPKETSGRSLTIFVLPSAPPKEAKSAPSIDVTSAQLIETTSAPPIDVTPMDVTNAKPGPSIEVTSIPSVDTMSAPSVDSKPAPSLDVRSTPSQDATSSPLVKSGSVSSISKKAKNMINTQSLAMIPKLDLSCINDIDTELTEPIRTRDTKILPIAKHTTSLQSIAKFNKIGAESFSKGKTTTSAQSLSSNQNVYQNKTEVAEPIRARGIKMLQRTKATQDEREPLSITKLDLSEIKSTTCGQNLPSIPKLNQSDAEWAEPIRTREIESLPRPKAPKFAKSLNAVSNGENPFTIKPNTPSPQKAKLSSTQSTPLFPPINVGPDGKVHQPKIIQRKKPEDITNTSGIKRRGLVLPDINLLSSNENKIKTSGQSFVLPTRPSFTNKKEEKHLAKNKEVHHIDKKKKFRF